MVRPISNRAHDPYTSSVKGEKSIIYPKKRVDFIIIRAQSIHTANKVRM